MSDLNESRRINYSTDEVFCRYLSIDLPLSLRSPTYTGKFGQELKKVGIEKLPLGITLSDLVLSGALAPSLYVVLPREYFDGWINFPECPRQSSSDDHTLARMYSCQPLPQQAKALNELLHPYDGELKATFKAKFQADIPKSFSACDHPNHGCYIPAEVYIPYWQVYALAGSFHKYRHADSFLSSKNGKTRCLELIKSTSVAFINKYGKAFDLISWYKTILAGATFSTLNCTHGQLVELTQKHSNVTADLLKQDLRLLLDLDADWNSILQKYGCSVLNKARLCLSKDIYLVYEQLRLLGTTATSIFDEFSPNYFDLIYTPIHEVLQSEGHEFRMSFVSLGMHYCNQIRIWGYDCTEEVFDALIQVPGFDAWMRAFHDLHASINDNKQCVSFRQNRIVDALIVISVRTEIVLREMFRSGLNAASDAVIVDFLKVIKNHLTDNKQKIISEACSKNHSENTKLHQRPDDIFVAIEQISFCKWSNEDVFFFRSLLRFITARNYFAHHAYKDDELNCQSSTLSKQILESLLTTLLFFQKHKKL